MKRCLTHRDRDYGLTLWFNHQNVVLTTKTGILAHGDPKNDPKTPQKHPKNGFYSAHVDSLSTRARRPPSTLPQLLEPGPPSVGLETVSFSPKKPIMPREWGEGPHPLLLSLFINNHLHPLYPSLASFVLPHPRPHNLLVAGGAHIPYIGARRAVRPTCG